MKTHLLTIAVAVSLCFSGCHSGEAGAGHGSTDPHSASEHEESEHDHTGEIFFTHEQAEAAGLTTETVSRGTFQRVIKTSGQIQSPQGDEATIVATANGIVSFTNPSLSEGTAIRAGETVVTVSAKNLLDGDPAEKSRIAFETAQKEWTRAEELVRDQIISTKEYEQIRLRYETARTTYEAQAPNQSAKGVRVSSPITGFLKSRLVAQGEYVSVGQPIAVVSQNRRLQLRAEVSENYYPELKQIRTAHFRPSYDRTLYRLSDLNGRLVSFGKTSDQSFYLPITFEFDNRGDLIPGSYVEVYLLSGDQEGVISIPVAALTEEQGLYFVYLQLDEEGYLKREVSPGASNGERVEVRSGLTEGERVVTHGVYQVKLAAVSSVMPEGHSH